MVVGDFFGWHVTLIVGPMRAAFALLIPLGVLVNLLACKVSGPRFICEHANLAMWKFIFHQ
jgi:hypothetical protein